MQKYSIQILALLLSIAAHLVAGYILGSSTQAVTGQEPIRPASSNLVVTLLNGSNDGMKEKKFKQLLRPQKMVDATSDNMMASPQMDRQNQSEMTSILPIAMLPIPYYFLPNELTESAYVVLDISSDLASLMPKGVSQLAILSLMINEYGDIDRVVMENSDLPEHAQQAVIDAFEKTRFQPGKVEGIAVKSQIKIEVMLENIEVKEIRRIGFPRARSNELIQ